MPRLNFDEIPDNDDFDPVPEGRYLGRVAKVTPKNTQAGDEMWNVEFVIATGDSAGRKLFDRIVFSENAAARKRAKLVFGCLGVPTKGVVDLEPEMIEGRTCWVDAVVETYTDRDGREKQRNSIPFAGYAPASKEEIEGATDESLTF